MKLQLLKKVALGVAMLLSQTTICNAQDSEETLNTKYWTMRERFRKYYISIGKNEGQGIPAAKRQQGGSRCGSSYPGSSGWMSWGDATGYLGDYMCTLATEFRLLSQQGKDTKATLNELYYALNAIDRLDGVAEPVFTNYTIPPNYNGFFLRDDVTQTTLGHWNTEFTLTGGYDPNLNYKCLNSDRENNLDGNASGNSCTNEVSFDQIVTIFQGFSFIKKYVPNVYVKPTPQDVGFNIIDKMQSITANIMEYMSGTDRQLLRSDHSSELMFNLIGQPTPAIFLPGTPLAATLNSALAYLIADSDCGDNDIRGNWILVNPVTGRKVGTCSNDTKGQDIRLFSYAFAKIAQKLTGDAQYLGRDIHHESIDHFGDGYYCLSKHDYHIPLSVVATAWNQIENMPSISENLVFSIAPISIVGVNSLAIELSSLPRNLYLFESLGAMSATWSQSNVNKFAGSYGHENMDLIFACLNDETPQNSQSHYINLLSKLSCDGPHNYGPSDFTSFWNNGNSFEHPTYDNIDTESYNYGEYNANDWMWLYNMYRLKFEDSSFPSYEDLSCNCKKSPTLEANSNSQTGILNNSITLKRVFKDYLKLGISLKEFNQGVLYIQNNKTLTNETELTICGQVYVSGNGTLINTGKPTNEDSIKVVIRSGSGLFIQATGTLDIGNNTKVIIQKGGQLVCGGNNSRIIIRSGGKLILESEAFLELNNGSKLVVENGGELIVKPKATTTLNNACKLIVEDGGQVIIQTNLSNPIANDNAVLTYNQGAEIQLKGDNAVLEINGRLHIGDNATFSITYPGSNSGYIKFNRGVGAWWDNWAPNNAHITCGTNARIILTGKNKTDKMIDITQINVAIPKNLTQFTMTKCLVEFNDPIARIETDRPTIFTNNTFTSGNGMNNAGRGLLVFGQPICLINNCDFNNLGTAITGALFYSGTKLTGVKKCNFYENGDIITYGGGVTISDNYFGKTGVSTIDATANSLIFKNTFNNYPEYYGGATAIMGPNVEIVVKENKINNYQYGITSSNVNLKLRCNDLQNNQIALLAATNTKVNMSDDLGGGYNNGNDCEKFAWFIETNMFEANNGFNNFKITNSNPCTWIPQSGHGPNIVPGHWDCPTITEGSIINFAGFNTASNKYEIIAENNFWRPLISSTDVIEDRQNKIRKIDITDINNPILDSAAILTGNILTYVSQADCPNGNAGCTGPNCRTNGQVHPLNDNSNASVISTASFYNKKLQKALKLSLNKMDQMQNDTKVNQAADLLTECLKYNYVTPVVNNVDKYLLELAYQKLFTCIVQLGEWHRDTVVHFNPMPQSLQNRFNDLHAICALRAGRKSITEADYKEISDLILLDKAMVYRISDNRQNALSIVNSIIASSPKASHLNMYQNFSCTWSTELNAINGTITVDEALSQLKSCSEKFSSIPKTTSTSNRMGNDKQESSVVYATEHAIAVYPNPTSGNLSIAYSLNEFKTVTFKLFNIQGKIIKSFDLNPEDKIIKIDNLNLENGMYFYTINGDDKNLMSKKLVVVK